MGWGMRGSLSMQVPWLQTSGGVLPQRGSVTWSSDSCFTLPVNTVSHGPAHYLAWN